MNSSFKKSQFINISISLVSAYFLMTYFRIAPNGMLWILISYIVYRILKSTYIKFDREDICLLIFSFLFGCSIVLGYHIVTNFDTYNGTKDVNYITAYSFIDLFALFFLTICVFPGLKMINKIVLINIK